MIGDLRRYTFADHNSGGSFPSTPLKRLSHSCRKQRLHFYTHCRNGMPYQYPSIWHEYVILNQRRQGLAYAQKDRHHG
jgi:hypothetical protein